MHVLIAGSHSRKAVIIRWTIAVAFLLAQFMGLVHAYEHHHDEHAQHQCEICLVHVHFDDLKPESDGTTHVWTNKRETTSFPAPFTRISWLYIPQSRAPPS